MWVCHNEYVHVVVLRFYILLQVGNQVGHKQKAGCKLSPPLCRGGAGGGVEVLKNHKVTDPTPTPPLDGGIPFGSQFNLSQGEGLFFPRFLKT